MALSQENHPRPRMLVAGGHLLPGVRRVVPLAQPAVGTEWSVGVPGGRVWQVLSSLATLTTSATVGNREPGIHVVVNGVEVWIAQSSLANTAGIAFQICGSQSGFQSQINANGGVIQLPTPEFWLPEGAQIGSKTRGLLGDDQYSNAVLWIAEYFGSETDIELRRDMEREQLAELLAGTPSTIGGPRG